MAPQHVLRKNLDTFPLLFVPLKQTRINANICRSMMQTINEEWRWPRVGFFWVQSHVLHMRTSAIKPNAKLKPVKNSKIIYSDFVTVTRQSGSAGSFHRDESEIPWYYYVEARFHTKAIEIVRFGLRNEVTEFFFQFAAYIKARGIQFFTSLGSQGMWT